MRAPFLRAAAVALSIFGLAVPAAASVHVRPLDTPVPDGSVNSVSVHAGRLYFGGDLTAVGPHTGPGLVVDPATGGMRSTARIEGLGRVAAAVPDGAGGWYVGGEFAAVSGGSGHHLAHILASGAADAAFDASALFPSPGLRNQVNALALRDGVLYVGGQLLPSGDGVAAIDARSGGPMPQFRAASLDVTALVAGPEHLYVGTGQGVTALDPVTGARDQGFAAPAITIGSSGETGDSGRPAVAALALAGGRLYLGGSLTAVGGRPRGYAASLDAVTGALDERFAPDVEGPVRSIVTDGRAVWLGWGTPPDEILGGSPSGGVVSTEPDTGAPRAGFAPQIARAAATALALSGSRLYVAQSAGRFEAHPLLVALDAGTGAALPGFAGPVLRSGGGAIALAASGDGVYVGGDLVSYGGESRAGLAALDLADGRLDPAFRPRAKEVRLVRAAGSRVYAVCVRSRRSTGDPFAVRLVVRAFDARSGAAIRGWRSPRFDADEDTFYDLHPTARSVSLAVVPGGGPTVRLTTFDLKGRTHRRSTRRASGSPRSPYGPAIWSLAFAGSRLYVAGAFSRLGGLRRIDLAAIDLRTHAGARRFKPTTTGVQIIQHIVASGSRIYAFASARFGQHLLAFDRRSGRRARGFGAPRAAEGGPHLIAERGRRVLIVEDDGSLLVRDRRSGRSLGRRTLPGVVDSSGDDNGIVPSAVALSRNRIYLGGHVNVGFPDADAPTPLVSPLSALRIGF